MATKILKPSDLKGVHPWNSITQHCEDEQSMAWLLLKLQETGDTFREITFEEYKSWKGIRNEKEFEQLAQYVVSPETICLFSPMYKEIAKALKEKPAQRSADERSVASEAQ